MTTKEWLDLVSKDTVSATDNIKVLYKILSDKLPAGNINKNVSLEEIFEKMRAVAKSKANNGFYYMPDDEKIKIASDLLELEVIKEKSLFDISFEDLL